MSGVSNIPRTPNQDRGEGSRKSNRRPYIPSGDFSPSKKQRPDDQTERNQPSPITRICNLLLSPIEFRYVTRVLTPVEVDPMNPVLQTSNDYEHFVFLNNPKLTGSIPYRVYDKSCNELFTSVGDCLSEWDTIVRDCGLMAGDRVWFCRYLDTGISGDFVYTLNSKREPPLDDGKNYDEALEVTELSTSKPVLRIIYRRLLLVKFPGQGPGSRNFPQQGHCITRTLTDYDVSWDLGKVFLSATDAVILADNPRILQIPTDGKYAKEDIQVFDVQNRKYTMTVSAHYSQRRGVFYYCLGGEWTNFVKRHNLKEGDQLMIYKCLDSTISPRYYHVFTYVSKKAVDVVRFKNDSVSAAAGETHKRNIPDGPCSRCLS